MTPPQIHSLYMNLLSPIYKTYEVAGKTNNIIFIYLKLPPPLIRMQLYIMRGI